MTRKHVREFNQNYNFNYNCSGPLSRTVTIPISQPCNNVAQVYFDDYTSAPGSFQIAISNTSVSCNMTLIVEAFNGNTVERVLLPNTNIAFLEDDVQRVSIRCQGDPGATCTGNMNVNKIFRFCELGEDPDDQDDSCHDHQSPADHWWELGNEENLGTLLKSLEYLKKRK